MKKQNAALSDLARRVGSLHTARPRQEKPVLPVRIELPGAKVMLLPGHYRDAEYVRRHVEHNLSRPADIGEANVLRNLAYIRKNLQKIGVSEPEIEREVRRIEGAVRAEIWRQVLLPDHNAGGSQ